MHFVVQSQWAGGFSDNITITNTGTTALNSWSLVFTFASGQQITQLWNGNYTEVGGLVTITNLSYNGTLAPGGTVSPGFNGTWTSSNPVPTAFSLNGVSCSVS